MKTLPRPDLPITNENETIGSSGLVIGPDVHRLSGELGAWLAEPYATQPTSARVLEKGGFMKEEFLRASV